MKGILAAALMTLAVAACGGSDAIAPDSVAGTYTLQTVNSSPPPFTLINEPNYKLEVLSGSYTLNADKTYSASAEIRETDAGTVTTGPQNETGTYTITGSTVTFTDTDGFTIDATISGKKLTLRDVGIVAVYSK